MLRKLVVAGLVLLSLGGCVVVPDGWGHHGWQGPGRYHDHYRDYRR